MLLSILLFLKVVLQPNTFRHPKHAVEILINIFKKKIFMTFF